MIVADATTGGKESAVFPCYPTVSRGWMIAASSVALSLSDVTASAGTMHPTQRVLTNPFLIGLCVGVASVCFNTFSMS